MTVYPTLHQYLQLLFPRELTEALHYCQQTTQAYSLKKPGWISIYKGWVVAIAITDAEFQLCEDHSSTSLKAFRSQQFHASPPSHEHARK